MQGSSEYVKQTEMDKKEQSSSYVMGLTNLQHKSAMLRKLKLLLA
jgi:hypothetical protein